MILISASSRAEGRTAEGRRKAEALLRRMKTGSRNMGTATCGAAHAVKETEDPKGEQQLGGRERTQLQGLLKASGLHTF